MIRRVHIEFADGSQLSLTGDQLAVELSRAIVSALATDSLKGSASAQTPPPCRDCDGTGRMLSHLTALLPDHGPWCHCAKGRVLNRENLRVRAQIQTGGHQAGDSAVASAAGAREEDPQSKGASS